MFAILAIVFAVGSAFTVNHKSAKKVTTQYFFKTQSDVELATFADPEAASGSFKDIATYVTTEDTPEGTCSEAPGENVCGASITAATEGVLVQGDLNLLSSSEDEDIVIWYRED